MRKFKCEAQLLIEKTFESETEEEAEIMMQDYMSDVYSDDNWVISVYEWNDRCWHPRGCRFNSNNSNRYMKCLQRNYSVDMCKSEINAELFKKEYESNWVK